jgi:hypothetical protein
MVQLSRGGTGVAAVSRVNLERNTLRRIGKNGRLGLRPGLALRESNELTPGGVGSVRRLGGAAPRGEHNAPRSPRLGAD